MLSSRRNGPWPGKGLDKYTDLVYYKDIKNTNSVYYKDIRRNKDL